MLQEEICKRFPEPSDHEPRLLKLPKVVSKKDMRNGLDSLY